MIFSSAVLYSIKVIMLTVTHACARTHTHTHTNTHTHRESVNDSVMLHLNPLQLSLSSDTENATRLSSKEEQNL